MVERMHNVDGTQEPLIPVQVEDQLSIREQLPNKTADGAATDATAAENRPVTFARDWLEARDADRERLANEAGQSRLAKVGSFLTKASGVTWGIAKSTGTFIASRLRSDTPENTPDEPADRVSSKVVIAPGQPSYQAQPVSEAPTEILSTEPETPSRFSRLVSQVKQHGLINAASGHLSSAIRVTQNYFSDTERFGERAKHRKNAATITILGAVGLSLMARYGFDYDMQGSEVQGGNGGAKGLFTDAFDGSLLDGDTRTAPEPALPDHLQPEAPDKFPISIPEAPDPAPEPTIESVALSSGDNPWTVGDEYARSLGYNLDPSVPQDLQTLDAIKDQILLQNGISEAAAQHLSVGQELKLPDSADVTRMFNQYHQ